MKRFSPALLVLGFAGLCWPLSPERAATAATAPWAANGIPACVTDSLKYDVYAVPDGSGGILLVWEDSRDGLSHYVAFAQRVTGLGSVATGWPGGGFRACSLDSSQGYPRIAPDGEGGGFVVWEDGRNGPSGKDQIYAQHIAASGSPSAGWPTDGVLVCNTGDEFPKVVPDGSGGCFVVWGDNRGPGQIYAQHLLSNGALAPGWPTNGIPVASIVSSQYLAIVGNFSASDEHGGFLITWFDWHDGVNDVYAQRITGGGVPAAGWPAGGERLSLVSSNGNQPSALASDGLGGAFVVWNQNYAESLMVQHLSPTGVVSAGWPAGGVVLAPSAGWYAWAISDGIGGVYVAWPPSPQSTTLYLQHITASGVRATGWPPGGLIIANAYAPASLIQGASGGVIATWNSGGHVRSQEWNSAGAVASGWPAGGFDLCALGTGGSVASASDGALGMIAAWSDTRNWRPQGGVFVSRITVSGDVDVQLAAIAGRLRLESPRPNPSNGPIEIPFELPSDGRARIEILDVMGRMREAREVGFLGAGRHTLEVGDGVKLGPGLYFVRLTQGSQVRLTRLALIE